MNQYFFDHLDTGVILVKDGQVTSFNQQAKHLLPFLGTDPNAAEWLAEHYTGLCGEIHGGVVIYDYKVVKQGEETMYLLEKHQSSPLKRFQLDSFLTHMRSDLDSMTLKIEGADLEDEVGAPLRHASLRMLRNLNNCDLAMGETLQAGKEIFDFSAMMEILSSEIASLFPDVEISQKFPSRVMVESNLKYLRKAVLGLCCNSLATGTKLDMKITQMKREALLEIADDQVFSKELGALMCGRVHEKFPSLQGVGFGILAVQQTLRSFHCNLWGEESPDGNLIMKITVPLQPKGKLTMNSSSHDMELDKEGGWSDLLLEFAPILKSKEYGKISQED